MRGTEEPAAEAPAGVGEGVAGDVDRVREAACPEGRGPVPGGGGEAAEARGNVVVACPAGGPACMVAVAADGTASCDRTGGTPSRAARRHTRDHARNYPTAGDLLDHWNDPGILRTAMALAAAGPSDPAGRKN